MILIFVSITASAKSLKKPLFKFYLSPEKNDKAIYLKKYASNKRVKLKNKPEMIVYKKDIKHIVFRKNKYNLAIEFFLSNKLSKKLAKITKTNIGKKMFLVINDKVILAPIIRGKIPNGKIFLSLSKSYKKVFLKIKKALKY